MFKLMELFLLDAEIQGKAPQTLKTYRLHLESFCGFHARQPNETPPHLIVHGWLSGMATSDQTKASRWRTVRAFWRWAADSGYVPPLSPRYKPRFQPAPIRIVPPREHVLAILRGIPRRLRVDRRDRALFFFIYFTGCRVTEAVTLRKRDIDLGVGRAQIYGKGSRFRIVPLVPELQSELASWLGHIPKPDDFLFPSSRRSGKPIDRHRAHERWIKRQGDAEPKMTVHDLRRAIATHALSAGVDSLHVKALLGHASLETTELYAKSDVSAARRILIEAFGDKA